MRRAPSILLCCLLASLTVLTACGGSGGSSGSLPTVSGSYGTKPKITFSGKPSSTLQKKVLKEGSGAKVSSGDLLVADYLGQIWKGKVFDNSYDRKQPAAFPIGVGKVIPGWDEALVGVKAGSRVLLVIPPDKGYGSQGNTNAGIKGTDTLVFVVDVINAYGKNAGSGAKATAQKVPAGLPKVTGDVGSQPTVTIPKGLAPPTKPTTTVLAKGTGDPVKAGLLVVQYLAVDWTGKVQQSTWQQGQPTALPVGGSGGSPSPLDSLIGVPLGSRVLIDIPAQDAKNASTQSTAIVLELVAEPGPAGSAG